MSERCVLFIEKRTNRDPNGEPEEVLVAVKLNNGEVSQEGEVLADGIIPLEPLPKFAGEAEYVEGAYDAGWIDFTKPDTDAYRRVQEAAQVLSLDIAIAIDALRSPPPRALVYSFDEVSL